MAAPAPATARRAAPAHARKAARSPKGAASAAALFGRVTATVLLAAMSLRMWYVQAVIIGPSPANKHEALLGVYIYLTCWTLVAVALHCIAAAVDAARRAAGVPPGRLTAAVHALLPALWALVSFMVIAFYALVWRDPAFQRDTVQRRVEQGIPFVRYMHELHALPAIFPAAGLLGALHAPTLALHLPSRARTCAHTFAFGGVWTAVMFANHALTDAFPYVFMASMTVAGRAAFILSSFSFVAAMAVGFRELILWRGGTAAARKRQ